MSCEFGSKALVTSGFSTNKNLNKLEPVSYRNDEDFECPVFQILEQHALKHRTAAGKYLNVYYFCYWTNICCIKTKFDINVWKNKFMF